MAIIDITEVQKRHVAAASKKYIAEFIGDQKMLDEARLFQAMTMVLEEASTDDCSNVGFGTNTGSEQRTTH